MAIDRVTGCPSAHTPDATEPATQVTTEREENRAPVRSGHILVVDDYLTNQQVAFMHLTAAGFSVDLAENGQQAVEAFDHTRYDLILMDIQMPVLNGFEATGKIRAMEAEKGLTRRTPILALTANAMKGDEEKCLHVGMDGYLIKPVRRHQLIDAADNWIGIKGRSGNSRPSPTPEQAVMPESVDASVMDIATAVEEFGDADTVKVIALQLVGNVDGQLQIIRESIANEDRERIRREAHAIKGGAATMEAHTLSNAAAHLEMLSTDGQMKAIDAGFGDLSNEFDRFREFISQWKGSDHENPVD